MERQRAFKKTDSGLLPHHVLVIISHVITQLLCKTFPVKIRMQRSDERPDIIKIFGLALSKGRRVSSLARGKESTPLHPPCTPSTHTRELKIPFYPDWSQEWAWKGWGQKAIFHGTEPLQWSCFDLTPPTPQPSSPTSANWTLSPHNCHPRRENPSSLNEAVHSNLLQTALWSVAQKSGSRAGTFRKLLPRIFHRFLPVCQHGQQKTAWTVEHRALNRPASLFSSLLPSLQSQ